MFRKRTAEETKEYIVLLKSLLSNPLVGYDLKREIRDELDWCTASSAGGTLVTTRSIADDFCRLSAKKDHATVEGEAK